MNKKGFEMVWSTWVIMVLAVILLIFLILFFTNSSGNFIDNIKGYFSSSNVDSVVKSCNLIGSSGEYNFCCDKKEVNYLSKGEKKTGTFTCSELLNQNFTNNKINYLNCNGVVC